MNFSLFGCTAIKKMKKELLNFLKINSRWLQSGIILLLLGYICLSWNTISSKQLSESIFAWNKLILAPILLFAGYALIGIAIMIEPEK